MHVQVRFERERAEKKLFVSKTQQLNKGTENVFGFTMLSILCAFCGLRMKVFPMDRDFGTILNSLLTLISFSVTLSTIMCCYTSATVVYQFKINFKHAIYFSAGVMGIAECLFRILYTTFRRHKMEKLFQNVQTALFHHPLTSGHNYFVKKISWSITIVLPVLLIAFGASVVSNYIASYGELGKILEEMQKNGTLINEHTLTNSSHVSIDIIEAWCYVHYIYKIWPSITLMKLYAALFYCLNFLTIARVIITDILFYAWYFIVIHKYNGLTNNLKSVLSSEDDDSTQLKAWIEFHNFLNELLAELNGLTAPLVVFAVISTGINISIASFAILRMYDEINLAFLLVFGITSIHQVLVYCIIGQKIREQAKNLHVKTYRSPWLDKNQVTQHAALMICTSANEKVGQCLPGAPFFALSLEFFASMLSGVATYFVVLLQIK